MNHNEDFNVHKVLEIAGPNSVCKRRMHELHETICMY